MPQEKLKTLLMQKFGGKQSGDVKVANGDENETYREVNYGSLERARWSLLRRVLSTSLARV